MTCELVADRVKLVMVTQTAWARFVVPIALAHVSSCIYDPPPGNCRISCDAVTACPSGFSCSTVGVCHADGEPACASIDEDRDGVADDTDNCPTVGNVDQADADGDHVGNPCDPHPFDGGDRVVELELFNHGFGSWAEDAGWTETASSITSPIVPSSGGLLTMLRHPVVTANKLTLAMGMRITNIGPEAQNNQIDILLDDANGQRGRCFLYEARHGQGLSDIYIVNDTMTMRWDLIPELTDGSSGTFKFSRDDPNLVCAFAGTSVQLPSSDQGVITVSPVIMIDDMQIQIDSIVLYDVQ